MFNPGAGGDTIPPSRCLTCYGRVTAKGYPALGTCTTLQYRFYNATCPHRCIHESLLAFYQLGNYYGRYTRRKVEILQEVVLARTRKRSGGGGGGGGGGPSNGGRGVEREGGEGGEGGGEGEEGGGGEGGPVGDVGEAQGEEEGIGEE